MKLPLISFSFVGFLLLASLSIQSREQQEVNSEEWGENDWGDTWEADKSTNLHGFAELATSQLIASSNNENSQPLEEVRLQLSWDDKIGSVDVAVIADVWHDQVIDDTNGDFREANFAWTMGESTDVKIGRQILTWGVGDLIFINDLFPKDWVSFLTGRDDEYLKSPSDALRMIWYGDSLNLDLVLVPEFESDKYLNGEKLSFYIPSLGIGKPDSPFSAVRPTHSDYEVSLRLFGTVDGTEWGIYSYRGFYKSPETFSESGQLTFSRLNVIGASLRQSIFSGIGKFEIGHYESIDDNKGTLSNIPNSQWRLLLGYEQELIKNLSGAFQFYVEKTENYDALISNSLAPDIEPNEWHKVLTSRLTFQALQQNLVSSFFVFYSPDDSDWHVRMKSDYRINDAWKISGGIYWFEGEDEFTFWSQFQENSSAWIRLRYQF
ncbi:hypothetical protein [Pleionea sediminis]|uniref:hypothetical protein n=1 Tax=Pleionea sediminis TaxID=2569479 RepID=UPI001186F934|nr:hypothetical protein [Pleionea sediminis]